MVSQATEVLQQIPPGCCRRMMEKTFSSKASACLCQEGKPWSARSTWLLHHEHCTAQHISAHQQRLLQAAVDPTQQRLGSVLLQQHVHRCSSYPLNSLNSLLLHSIKALNLQ
jgi:hypothetical protein